MIGASPSYSSTNHCTYLEADSSSSSISSHSSCLPQHEACLRHMLSEEDRVVADGYRTTTRRRHSSSTSTAGDLGHLTVWRERVAQWVYTVVDHVDADRSAVYNVLLLLDAYLDAILSASSSASAASHNFADAAIDAPTYQLLAMSCLYLVLRLRDDGAHRLSIEQLVSMSRSDTSSSSSSSSSTTAASSPAVITPARIARTMKSIVRTLESTWRRLVFAPSPGEFVVAYVEQMQHHQHCTRSSNGTGTGTTTSSSSGSSKIDDLLQATRWSALLDDAAYLAELSVCDTYLRNDRPSVIAYAALLNVLRCHSESFAAEEEEEANTNNNTNTLKQDLQSLRVLTGYVNVTKTTVKTIYSRLGYVQSQSLDAMAPTSSSRVDQQGVKEEAATNTNTTNIVPQDDDDEVEAEEEVEEREVVAVMAPAAAAAAIVSAATSPSSSTAATATAATTGGVKRCISAVVSYDELLAVVDATLPPASISSSSDSEEEEENLPMSSSSSSPSGMKRVRSYSSDLSSFAAPDDEVAKRTRLVESHE